MKLHDLRHLAATTLAKDVKDIKVIQEYLGDSTVVATMRYLAVTDEARDEVGQALGRRFARYAEGAPTATVTPIRAAR
jgi:integrase